MVGNSWGVERTRTISSSCDADGFYKAKIRDKVTDGYCVEVQMKRPDFSVLGGTDYWQQGYGCAYAYTWYDYGAQSTWLVENAEQDRDVRICKLFTSICRAPKPMWGF